MERPVAWLISSWKEKKWVNKYIILQATQSLRVWVMILLKFWIFACNMSRIDPKTSQSYAYPTVSSFIQNDIRLSHDVNAHLYPN